MALFYLHGDTGPDIEVPEGISTIGRGPFLKVADKRVSRSHGQLKVDGDKLLLLPTHTNPCFYAAAPAAGSLKPLPRNQWQELCDGDKFSLLPNSCIFAVIQHLITKPLEEHGKESDSSTDIDESMQQAAAEAKAAASKECGTVSSSEPQKLCTVSKASPTAAGRTSDERSLINNAVPGTEPFGMLDAVATEKADSPVENAGSKNAASSGLPPVKAAVYTNKPSTMKRQLPAWLLSSSSKGGSKISGLKAASDASYKDDEETKISKTGKAPQRSKTKTKLKDFSDSEDELGLSTSTASTAAPVGGKKQQLADFSNDSSPEQKRKAPQNLSVSKQMGGKQALALKDFSDSDDDGKARGKTGRPKGGGGGKRPVGLRDFSDGDLSGDENQPLKKQARMSAEGSLHAVRASSDKEDKGASDDDLPPCQYGTKCYRKNPQHFQEYSHPPPLGTAKTTPATATSADGNDSGDGNLPECPYGKLCYRKNPAHQQQFAHNLAGPEQKTRRSTRKRTTRSKKGRSVLEGDSDDDGEPNTYDYNDSFLDDDDDSDSMDFTASDSEDEDWDPGSDADVGELLSEAKGFLKNKKMQKPA